MVSELGKSTTTLTLDVGVVKALHAQSINVSRVVNEFLKSLVNITPEQIEQENIKKQILEAEAKVIMAQEHLLRLKKIKQENDNKLGAIIKIGHKE